MKIQLKSVLLIVMLLLLNIKLNAQHKHHRKQNKTVVVIHQNKIKHVKGHRHKNRYRPFPGSRVTFYSRWVYFPRYNFYWDNFNKQYVYFQNNGWMRSTVLPSIFINVNPVEEQKHELEFKNDSINEIEQENEEHIKNYPIHH